MPWQISLSSFIPSKSKIFNLFEEGDVYILSIESNDKLELGNLQKGLLHFSQNQEKYLYRISSNNQSNLFNFVEKEIDDIYTTIVSINDTNKAMEYAEMSSRTFCKQPSFVSKCFSGF